MALNFLPGQPNSTQQTVCQGLWQDRTLLAYCSGNNLIIVSNDFSRLQTICFDFDCVAVDINSYNGHIAVASGSKVHVFKPLHQVMKTPRWVSCIDIFHDDSPVNSISWGLNGEIAVGSDYLSFWRVQDEFGEFKSSLLWTKKQFRPVYRCAISEDSQVIASMYKYSRTVKMWKRISLGNDRVLFDLTFISHPGYVTYFRWKRSDNRCERERNSHVFYTLCTDLKLRIWTYYENNSQKTIQQWGHLNLDPTKDQRFCLLLDSWLVQKLLQGSKIKNSEYYSEMHPDFAVLANCSGELEFYALENLSHDPPKLMDHKLVATATIEQKSFVFSSEFLCFAEPQVADEDSSQFSLVVHDMRGVLRHSIINLESVLSGEQREIGTLLHKFTGHKKSIQKLVRSSDGQAMITLSRFSENTVWVPQTLPSGVYLRKKNIILSETPLIDAVVLERGSLILTLSKDFKLNAWTCSNDQGSKLSTLEADFALGSSRGAPLLMINTPEKKHHHDRHYVALIYSSGEVLSFCISLPDGIIPIATNNLDIGEQKKIYLISSIDPVNYGFHSDRSLVALIDEDGLIRTFKCAVQEKKVTWRLSYKVETNLHNSTLISGSSIDKICVVAKSEKRLTIWDLRRAFLEYETEFSDPVCDIDWTSTRFSQSIFSVGFADHVLLFTQQRYDYTTKIPSYSPVEEIAIREYTTHDIGDSIWLTDGTFVIASGNQLFLKDKSLDIGDKFTNQSIGSRKILLRDIMHLSSVLNGPLPVYHPQLLIQALYSDKLLLVKEVLLRLFLALRRLEFHSADATKLGATLGLTFRKFIHPSNETYVTDNYPEPYNEFNGLVSSDLKDKLTKHVLPFITRHQQVTLIAVIEAIDEIDKNKAALDLPGTLFILGLKLFELHRKTQLSVHVRDIQWALHSSSKKALFSSVLPSIDSWERARQYKISLWVNREDLIASFEKIAKHEFSNGIERDPRKSGLFYLSLRKKQILISLWRVSTGNPEQQKMLKFLNNDFREERWRKAALKNAFVLLSKHRYLDSACFFLLSDSLRDAAIVVLKQMDDIALAIGICRLYEGDHGPVLKRLLVDTVLPRAIKSNDRWMTSFIYQALEKPSLVLKALVMSPIDLEDNKEIVSQEDLSTRSYLVEDPALLMLYAQIRRRNEFYFAASMEVQENLEYKTVQRVSAIYSRMGCDYLALSLLMNWCFHHQAREEREKSNYVHTPVEKFKVSDTRTKKLRSIFDKFDELSQTPSDYSSRNSAYSASSTKPKNLLDNIDGNDQNQSPGISQQGTDESATSSMNSSEPALVGNNLTSATTPLLDKNETNNYDGKVKSTHLQQPRNLLDDFF
ncbi:LAME_0E12178g1_1 [Lachancea meyersii CBS 8951]|uniref:LAME_0E12178g1_1 n=1 Tax=Lachancea meyersii CBS 8951 TaxID=1266667 RepID=A0A1G4JLG9_9SACH|nr:LAME_0E12178g1_1 [Lachancea meyersii CBS 8951]